MEQVTTWRKSTFSGEQGACVEVSNTLDGLRDSKCPHGGVLATGGVKLLVAAVKREAFTA